MTPLKDLYSPAFYDAFAAVLARVLPAFDSQQFIDQIFDAEFGQKELKDRMRHTARVLHQFLPVNFGEAVGVIDSIIQQLRTEAVGKNSFLFLFLPDYIETYGINDYDDAVKAIESVTQYVSCEFAVRPFLLNYPDRMMAQMHQWSLHESYTVRRLASEGSRPRLPWAMAIPALKKDPTPVLALLENLKSDPSEYVRRSVANNLNDISKDHPAVVLQIANAWKGGSKETDAIVKHGCRTLLKQGHPDVLALYGLNSASITLESFSVLTPIIRIGESVVFTFSLLNTHTNAQTVRLEYAIYYRKGNGQLSKKVFKISERIYAPNERTQIIRKQKFIPITTRRFYPGKHRVSLIINGQEKEMIDFELV